MITPKIKKEGTQVVFGPCRLSYTHLFQKFAGNDDSDGGKYQTNVLIPKDEKETVDALESAVEQARKAAVVSKWHGKDLKKFESPLRDGDDKDDPEYEGMWYLNAKCKTRPGIVDSHGAPIADEEEIYSGVWCYVSVTFYGYDFNGNKGVAVGLNNVMKYKDGDRMGGRSSAESDFEGITSEEEEDW